MKAFKVRLGRKEIDTVFYGDKDPITAAEVRSSLVNHDGYDPGITVTQERKRKLPVRRPNPTNMTVAKTILEQLGGRRFVAMTGAKHFVGGDDMLAFSLPRGALNGINKVRITLTPRDDYTVEFFKVTGSTFKQLAGAEGVHAPELRRIFTRWTGLETSLGTMGNPRKGRDREIDDTAINDARTRGEDKGQAAASWVFDGNTTDATYRKVRQLLDDGDPRLDEYVREPDWLSGEWAGESISELLGDLIEQAPASEDEIMDAFEEGARTGFWDEINSNIIAAVGRKG